MHTLGYFNLIRNSGHEVAIRTKAYLRTLLNSVTTTGLGSMEARQNVNSQKMSQDKSNASQSSLRDSETAWHILRHSLPVAGKCEK